MKLIKVNETDFSEKEIEVSDDLYAFVQDLKKTMSEKLKKSNKDFDENLSDLMVIDEKTLLFFYSSDRNIRESPTKYRIKIEKIDDDFYKDR